MQAERYGNRDIAYRYNATSVITVTSKNVDEGTDTGPIIMQKAVEVRDDDTPEVLQRRIMEQAEWVILPEVINLIAEGRVSVSEGHVKIKK